MNKIAFSFAFALFSLPIAARAQVGVQIRVALPAAPPLVVVQPGVQVVEDQDDEIFFTSGWYWMRRDDVWYRARRPHAAFVIVEPRRVPVVLVRMEPGHYRHWHRVEAREERHEWREHERGEWREHDRREWHKEHGRGHGHGHHERHDD